MLDSLVQSISSLTVNNVIRHLMHYILYQSLSHINFTHNVHAKQCLAEDGKYGLAKGEEIF